MSAQHRAWLADRAARTVNVLLATASCGHPDAMAAADDINLTLEMLDCATWRSGDLRGEARAWQEANAQLATCAPGVRALLRLKTYVQESIE